MSEQIIACDIDRGEYLLEKDGEVTCVTHLGDESLLSEEGIENWAATHKEALFVGSGNAHVKSVMSKGLDVVLADQSLLNSRAARTHSVAAVPGATLCGTNNGNFTLCEIANHSKRLSFLEASRVFRSKDSEHALPSTPSMIAWARILKKKNIPMNSVDFLSEVTGFDEMEGEPFAVIGRKTHISFLPRRSKFLVVGPDVNETANPTQLPNLVDIERTEFVKPSGQPRKVVVQALERIMSLHMLECYLVASLDDGGDMDCTRAEPELVASSRDAKIYARESSVLLRHRNGTVSVISPTSAADALARNESGDWVILPSLFTSTSPAAALIIESFGVKPYLIEGAKERMRDQKPVDGAGYFRSRDIERDSSSFFATPADVCITPSSRSAFRRALVSLSGAPIDFAVSWAGSEPVIVSTDSAAKRISRS